MGNSFSDCIGVSDQKPPLETGFQVNFTEDDDEDEEDSTRTNEQTPSLLSKGSKSRNHDDDDDDDEGDEDEDEEEEDEEEDDDDDEEEESESATEGEYPIPRAMSSKTLPATPWDNILDLSNQYYFDSSTDSAPWTSIGYDDVDYRAFVLLIHPTHGLVLLHCTRKKTKPPHYQLPGGHVDAEEFEMHEHNLFLAAQAGAARELWEETGIDLRFNPAMNRLLPLILRPIKPSAGKKTKSKKSKQDQPLPNEYKDRLFFVASVTNEDFQSKPDPSKGFTRCRNHDIRLFLDLSAEHSGFWFERDPQKAKELLQLHSGGKVSKALAMALSAATGDPVLDMTSSVLSDRSARSGGNSRRNSRPSTKTSNSRVSSPPPRDDTGSQAVSPPRSPTNKQRWTPASPQQPRSPVRFTDDPQKPIENYNATATRLQVDSPKGSRPSVDMVSPDQSPIPTTVSPAMSPPQSGMYSPDRYQAPQEPSNSFAPSEEISNTQTQTDLELDPSLDNEGVSKQRFVMSFGSADDTLRMNTTAQGILDVTTESCDDSIHEQAIEDMLAEEFGSSMVQQPQGQSLSPTRTAPKNNVGSPGGEESNILKVKTDDEDVKQASEDLWAEEEARLKAHLESARLVAEKYTQQQAEEQVSPKPSSQAPLSPTSSQASTSVRSRSRLEIAARHKSEEKARIKALRLEKKARMEAAARKQAERDAGVKSPQIKEQQRIDETPHTEGEEREGQIKMATMQERVREEAKEDQTRIQTARMVERTRMEVTARGEAEKAREEKESEETQMNAVQIGAATRQEETDQARIKASQMKEQARMELAARIEADEQDIRIKVAYMKEQARLEEAEEEARIKEAKMKEHARFEEAVRKEAEEEDARIKAAKAKEIAFKEEATRKQAEEEAKIKAARSEEKARRDAVARQEAKEKARLKAAQMEEQLRREEWARKEAEENARIEATQMKELPRQQSKRISRHAPQSMQDGNKPHEASFDEKINRTASQEEQDEVVQHILAEFTGKKDQAIGSDAATVPVSITSREGDLSVNKIKSPRTAKSPPHSPYDKALPLNMRDRPEKLKSPSQPPPDTTKNLLTASYSIIAKKKREQEELERRQAEDALAKAQQAKEAERFEKIQRMEEERKRIRMDEQRKAAAAERHRSSALEAISSSNGMVTRNEKTPSSDKLVLLVSSISGNPTQKGNQARIIAILNSNNLPYITIDASYATEKERRNMLFEISGIRGNYPQLFLERRGQVGFVGDFDTIASMNDAGTLKEIIKPRNDSGLAPNEVESFDSSSSHGDGPSIVNGKSLLVLISTTSGNYAQKAQQERALVMLNSSKIQAEVIDGSNPAMTNVRNELFKISGLRGQYPQFFLKHVDAGKYSFLGDFEAIEILNDQGPLEELFQ